MKRRNFIKNAGLSVAGLALSNSIFGKSSDAVNSRHIIILLSGGVQYFDILQEDANSFSVLFQEEISMKINCFTQLNYSGKEMEHSAATLQALHSIPSPNGKMVYIGNKNSASTKAVKNAALALEVIETSALDQEFPFSNDAAVFEMASHHALSNDYTTIILNLEDTDIAHYNAEKYKEILNFYSQQINQLCRLIYDPSYQKKSATILSVASVLGRNMNPNELLTQHKGGTDHYDESARKLFAFTTGYSESHQVNFEHSTKDIAALWTYPDKINF